MCRHLVVSAVVVVIAAIASDSVGGQGIGVLPLIEEDVHPTHVRLVPAGIGETMRTGPRSEGLDKTDDGRSPGVTGAGHETERASARRESPERLWPARFLLAALEPDKDKPAAGLAADVPEQAEGGSGVRALVEIDLMLLISPDLDGFEATRTTGGWFPITETEEIEGVGSFFPTVRAGISIQSSRTVTNITVGAGGVVNGALGMPVVLADFAIHAKVGRRITLGAHIGPAYFFEPTWFGDADVDFASGSFGGIAGFSMTFELTETIAFRVMVDGVYAEPFDVTGTNGWTLNQTDLDISGVGVGVGVLFRF